MSLDEFYNSMNICKSQPVAASKKKRHDRNYIQARLPPELKAELDELLYPYKYDGRYGLKKRLVVAGLRWALDRVRIEGWGWLMDQPKKEEA